MSNNYNSCVEGCSLPSTPNDLKVIVNQLKREVEELSKTTEAKLLCHDGKIAEMCKYIKDNLSNSIRCLLDSMMLSGELDQIINDVVISSINERIIFIDTLSQLKNSILQTGDTVKTLGYHKINDGGSGLYKIREYNSDIEDMGSIIIIKNGKVAELVNENKYVNVNQFGLTDGNYLNDYWNNIYNYALKNKYYIHFPKGKYNVRKTTTNNYIFTGKFISMNGDNSIIYCDNSCDSNTDLFKFIGCVDNYNQFIKGIKFEVEKGYQNIRYFINFVFNELSDILYNLQIQNNLFGKNSSYAIFTEGYSNGGFNNCNFSHNIVYGLFMKSLSFGDSNKIIGNSLYGSEEIQLNDYVINLKQTPGSSCCKVADNNCTSGLGYFEEFTGLVIENNQIENTIQTGIDYLIKCFSGNNISINNCNLNAHYNSGLVFNNSSNSHMKNCNFYGCKDGKYLIETNNSHLIIVENPRYFNGSELLYKLDGKRINGYVTNALYDNDNFKGFIDNNLMLHIKPKVVGSFTIAPLSIETEGTNYDIPVESVSGNLKFLHINNLNSIKTESLLNGYACVKIKNY